MTFQQGLLSPLWKFLDSFELNIDELENILAHNKILVERSADIGVMPKDIAISQVWRNRAKSKSLWCQMGFTKKMILIPFMIDLNLTFLLVNVSKVL